MQQILPDALLGIRALHAAADVLDLAALGLGQGLEVRLELRVVHREALLLRHGVDHEPALDGELGARPHGLGRLAALLVRDLPSGAALLVRDQVDQVVLDHGRRQLERVQCQQALDQGRLQTPPIAVLDVGLDVALDLLAQLVHRLELAHFGGEGVVQRGQPLLLDALQRHLEVTRLPGQGFLVVVGRVGHREAALLADAHAAHAVGEGVEHVVAAQLEEVPRDLGAEDGVAVLVHLAEVDAQAVAVGGGALHLGVAGAALLERLERALHAVGRRVLAIPGDGHALGAGDRHLGSHLHGGLEAEGAALLAEVDVAVLGVVHRVERDLVHRLMPGARQQPVQRVVGDLAGVVALHHRLRHLALAEAGQLRLAADAHQHRRARLVPLADGQLDAHHALPGLRLLDLDALQLHERRMVVVPVLVLL